MTKLLVVGGGSWGTAFANYLASLGKDVTIWIREKEVLETIAATGENAVFLPGIKLSPRLKPTGDLAIQAAGADIIIPAVPSKFIRYTFQELKGIMDGKVIVNLSKGFEASSLKTISQLAAEIFGPAIFEKWITISGPSFARELAMNYPTAVAASSKNEKILKKIQADFSSDTLRLYRTDDLLGIEVAGSMKNVMAIASGIIWGSGYGYNTTASLVTRASVEISRFGVKLGARPETFFGLAGIGDLMLTCFGPLSRNFQLGERIARGESLEEIEKSSVMIVEGVETTKAVKLLSEKLAIEMPITEQVYEILFNRKSPAKALKELMTRSLKSE